MSPENAAKNPIRTHRLAIASPCDEAWDDMAGSERVRHCGTCRQNVYNVSEMTVGQAIKLIRENEGKICIRMLLRRDGTVVTQDCRDRLRALRRRGTVGLALFLLLFIPVTLGAQVYGWFGAKQCLTGVGPAGSMQGDLVMGEPMVEPPTPDGRPAIMGKIAPRPLMGSMAVPPKATPPKPQPLRGHVQ